MAALLKRKWWITIAVALVGAGLAIALVLWDLTPPSPHPTINENVFKRIKVDMSRAEVETLLAGPPRVESNRSRLDLWDKTPQVRWGEWIVPPTFRSILDVDPPVDEIAKNEMDRMIQRAKDAEIVENGQYLLAWHHDLATITVVLDGKTDEVRGAALWRPHEKSWRDHAPFRWFR